MAVGFINPFVPTILLTLVVSIKSSFQDNRQWLYMLTSSLHEGGASNEAPGNRNDQLWNLPPYQEGDYSNMREMGQIPELRQLFATPENTDRNKRNYLFDGLLCCNHPPTKPPSVKRLSMPDERLKSTTLSETGHTIDESRNIGQKTYMFHSPPPVLLRKYSDPTDESQPQIWNPQHENSLMLERRGVTATTVRELLQQLKWFKQSPPMMFTVY